MKQVFARSWKASTQPRKQRKYVAQAPDHIKSKMVSSRLSKELSEKYKQRSVRVRVGDVVKVLRGQHKGKQGKIESIDVKNAKLIIEKVEYAKKDGATSKYPIDPSNVVVLEVVLTDKKRKAKLESTAVATPAKTTKKAAPKTASKPAPKKEAEAKKE